MQELSSSSRRLPKATYAPIQFDQQAAAALSRGFEKASLLRGMQLQAGEVAAVRNSMGSASTEIPDRRMDLPHDLRAEACRCVDAGERRPLRRFKLRIFSYSENVLRLTGRRT